MKFKTIYADLPWQFKVWGRDTGLGRSAEAHYPTQGLEYLKTLDIMSIADDDCTLLLWVTWPTLREAFELVDHWNKQYADRLSKQFTYKTAGFVWTKLNRRWWERLGELFGRPVDLQRFQSAFFFGMGYWTRANTEACLIFTRGKPSRNSKSVRQLIVSPIRAHSQKPDEAYERIESMFDGPYVEVFARQRREGWYSIGNEIDGLDVKVAIEQVAQGVA